MEESGGPGLGGLKVWGSDVCHGGWKVEANLTLTDCPDSPPSARAQASAQSRLNPSPFPAPRRAGGRARNPHPSSSAWHWPNWGRSPSQCTPGRCCSGARAAGLASGARWPPEEGERKVCPGRREKERGPGRAPRRDRASRAGESSGGWHGLGTQVRPLLGAVTTSPYPQGHRGGVWEDPKDRWGSGETSGWRAGLWGPRSPAPRSPCHPEQDNGTPGTSAN